MTATDDNPSDAATFRDKVFLYYQATNVLPSSVDLLATHYVSALMREDGFDADHGPVLPGCDTFGPEVSPREIIARHTRARHPAVGGDEFLEIVEAAIARAEREITNPSTDVFGRRYQSAGFC
ncbi:hypothetical protein HFO56_24255 [Rhizobium laguerreae]|uniref:hypothetical protein n=1 Tax=Rhizobium laguerreae TaxID=1076926 RepID=UPI001C8FF679|nr:hypothetical protein [Rhizobium laguerreae]MBY3155443.1 hypothetical protein [Rhizobium laguerreae]MBY3433892.1 hypothetical protein [Rhizobium laguerreae]